MWNKVKWVVIGVSIGWLFYLNYQTNQQLRDRIDRIDVESSHHRTDIIGLKGDYKATGITMTFHRNEINIANALFRKDLVEDVEHTLGMMESKLSRLEDIVERYSSQSDRFNESMKDDYNLFITALDTTLQITDKETLKGRQTLQEQIDQLRLEFNELIQKLEEHKRTKDIFQ